MRRGLLLFAFASLLIACVPERGHSRFAEPDPPDMGGARILAHPSSLCGESGGQPCPPCTSGGEFPCEQPDMGSAPDLVTAEDMLPPQPDLLPPGSPCTSHEECSTWCDCITHKCHAEAVLPGCADGKQDNLETDVDCGGPECEPCKSTQSCQGGLGNVWWPSYCMSCFCVQDGNGNRCL